MIAAVILAAGSGRRMGQPKALLEIQGETLLARMVKVATEAGCNPVLAVVGDWDAGRSGNRVKLVLNVHAAEGMASSIRAGIGALPEAAEAALLLTVDQPAVDVALLKQLLSLSAQDPDRPVACAYAATLGIPAVLPRRLFPDLLALSGDHGAKGILLREQATPLPFPGGEQDLDTPEDLDRLRR